MRITWRNVAAPNFNDSVAALSAAGRLFSSAADIGSTAAHARAGREQLAFERQQAAAKAQRDAAIQNANALQLQRALAGYNPDDPNSISRTIAAAPASLVGDAIGYFEQLDASRAGILNRQQTVADIVETRAGTQETLIGNQQAAFDLALDQEREEVYGPLSRSVEQNRLRNENDQLIETRIDTLSNRNAADYATQAALNTSSPESVLAEIQRDQTSGAITADQAARRTAAVQNIDPNLFFVDPDAAAAVSEDEDVRSAREVIDARRQEFNASVAGDPLMAYGSMLFDDPNPQEASKRFVDLMIERTGQNIELDDQVYEDSIGEMQRAVNIVRDEFRGSGIPDNVIHAVVASHLESSDWIFQRNEQVQLDVSGAIETLRQFDTIGERSNLAARMRDMHATQNELNEFDRQFESSFRDLALGSTRGNSGLIEQGRKRIQKLNSTLAPPAPQAVNATPQAIPRPGASIVQSGQNTTGQTRITNPASATPASVDARIEYLQNRRRLTPALRNELNQLLESRRSR